MAPDGLLPQLLGGTLGRAQQQAREVVGEDAVELLGHAPVEAAHAGLDVSHRQRGLGGGQAAGERRVRVSIDENGLGSVVLEHRGQGAEHGGGLGRVRPTAQAQLDLRPGNVELAHEDARQLVVVVLAGVDEQLVVLLPQMYRDSRRLDELRPVPDHRDHPHRSAV